MFINVPFPECLAFGAVAAPEWKTVLAENQGGWTQANQVWVYNKHSYDVSTAVRTRSDYLMVLEHFNEVRGRANTFPFRDPMDFEVPENYGYLVYVSPGVYQLAKRYGTVNPYYRKITRPDVVALDRNGLPMTPGGGAGQYSLDATTGKVTVQPDQTRTINSHTVGATHQFTLSSALSPNVTVGGYVFASGVTGTGASALNGIPLEVTAVSGANVSVAVNTTGLTASGGTLAVRAQPSEMSWIGTFWVPVRYGIDRLPGQIVNSNGQELFAQATSITLTEDRE